MDLLVRAFAAAGLPDVDLKIVGQVDMGYAWAGPDDQRIQVLSGIDDETLAHLYRGASLFVYPSSAEGFGIPLLDATLFGIPVISSNLTSMPEVGGSLPTYFDPTRVAAMEELADLIQGHFAGRPIYSPTVAERKRQLERFSWESIARRFWALVDTIHSPGIDGKSSEPPR